jgi:hypothetical protein
MSTTGPFGGSRVASDPGGENGGPAHAAQTPDDWQHRLWLVLRTAPLIAALVGLLFGLVLGFGVADAKLRGKTTYSSTTVMLIDDPALLATSGGEQQLLKLSSLRVKYSTLLNTDPMAIPIADKLHLPLDEVLTAVVGNVSLEGLLMDVTATWSTAQEARLLSQTAANEVTAYVKDEDTTYGIPKINQFIFRTINPATPAVSNAPSKTRAAATGLALLLIGFVVAFAIVQFVRNRRLFRRR